MVLPRRGLYVQGEAGYSIVFQGQSFRGCVNEDGQEVVACGALPIYRMVSRFFICEFLS